MIKHLVSAIFVCMLFMSLSACTEDESDDLAKAQDCLNKVSQTNPTTATACLTYIEKYTSQQARILKCSIYMTSGGLVENKVVAAYTAIQGNSYTNKEAAFMMILALDQPDVTAAYETAKKADAFCQATGVKGLQYISGIILSGTYLSKTYSDLNSGTPIDLTDSTTLNTQVSSLITQCTSATPPAACSSDATTLGTAVTNLSSVYCSGSGADAAACKKIEEATAAGGSDPEDVGRALFCYMGNKSYDPVTDLCI